MDYHSCANLAAMFFAEATRQGDRPFLWAKPRGGTYQPLSWAQAREQVTNLARGLRTLGLQRGERVMLVAENRPEWVIADFAIMAAGGITVPSYITHTPEDLRHVMTNCEVRMAIASTAALASRVVEATKEAPSVAKVIVIEPPQDAIPRHVDLRTWNSVLELGARGSGDVEAWAKETKRDDIACLIYTSGTGGAPKGVMTTHANILANCYSAFGLLEKLGLGHEVFLSFLPMSHSYEHTAGMMFPISIGAQIYFAEGADTLATNLTEARPTIMTAVPRLYEAFHQRILRAMEREGGFRTRLFFKALELGLKRLDGKTLNPIEYVQNWALEILVRKKMQARFGGRLKAMVSGGAALNPDIGRFFLALGLRLLQGYGQTESAPVISANPPDHIKIETVGLPVAGVEVSFAEDGEILVRGANVMKGYWNDPESSARALADGWLHTGDVGQTDDEGFLVITDRKKDFIKTSGGDMIAPARIEGYLTLQGEIGQAMVAGDSRPYLVALLVPSQHLTETVMRQKKLSAEAKMSEQAEVKQAIEAAVARVNARLAPLERIRRFAIIDEAFTTANHQMTPTLKIRRHVIRRDYNGTLEKLYEGKAG